MEVEDLRQRLAEAQKKEMNIIFQQRVQFVDLEVKEVREKIKSAEEHSRLEGQLIVQIENIDSAIKQTTLTYTQWENDLEETKNKLIQCLEEIQNCENKANLLNSESSEKKLTLDTFEHNLKSERQQFSQSLSKMKQVLDEIQRVQLKISNSNFDSRLLSGLEQEKSETEQSVENCRYEVDRFKMIIANCELAQQQLRLLEDQMRLFLVREKLQTLQKELQNLGLDQNHTSNELQTTDDRLNRKVLELNNLVMRRQGQKEEMQKKLREINLQLKSESMQNAKAKLRSKLVQKIVMQASIEDLKKYGKVLDDSIIAFHHKKMEQINQILRELWPRVYQGNDIESIMIKSQPVASGERKKSYDYSVVMVVDQQEIDMRDRCSAGQKVLASILIRIALADVFGANCPILALDEPTTNLDASKVENVGSMLRDLLDVCSGDKDNAFRSQLQLIVITHDRRLVDHLYLACRPELLYVLSKDESGNSHISTKTALNDGCFSY